ncbi:NO-inducible flavohemoprotein [Rossellomorea aquimaris]|uniref:Flavohemoprotein n=1 Tax=Rossellomorea aquimaris TaxID=189382 RepID=A0A5D4U2Y1_9BACI|nr:NO-inducible flavohemoprotein [Rossellomorea aquimaris]TYS81459.1 NO-inducible flavohemoprotein [Rossellomorea aquimaris]TYS88082.1 NO-inducible flavohemoprotein [Rossellomorea aquimaris]
MLSQKTIEIVKSTAPVLEIKGTEITSTFYKNLFTNHPELLNIFNHANQKKGRQQTALANTVYAAAQNIDKLEMILPVVKQIAHKHRSLGVKPEHYPIVGEHLLQAIKQVLGDAATDEIIEAWGEAYGVIARVFIDVEEEMYKETENKDAGYRDFKPFIVAKKVVESDSITSFYLQPKEGGNVPTYMPGQYISVRVSIPGEEFTHIRQYSLSSAPMENVFRISVKREAEFDPQGKVTNFLHDKVAVGSEIEVSAPAGDFYLADAESPVAFISGGVGITPMMSMLETVARTKPERPTAFIHASKHEGVHAFRNEVDGLMEELMNGEAFYVYENPRDESQGHFKGYVNKEILTQYVDGETECYVCGPVPFMKAVISTLKEMGVPESNIHFEFFGPAMDLSKKESVSV